MRTPTAFCLWTALGAMLTAPIGQTQRAPHIGYVFPAGGQSGQTFEAKLAGQYLDGVRAVVVSGGGVRGRILEYVKPLNGRQINLLRDRSKAIQQALRQAPRDAPRIAFVDPARTNVTERLTRAEAVQELALIREKLANPKNRNRTNRQLSEDVRIEIRIAPDAEPGFRELRLLANGGLSNPVLFSVGRFPEATETEPNQSFDQATDLPPLPVVVNGQIQPGDVDRFRLKLRGGMGLVVDVAARQLVPYLADAVPGWFQAAVALYDRDGREVAFQDDFRFRPDPLLYFEPRRDGEYFLEIRDSIYRGREDFVYRITVGELPRLTGLFPLGGSAGQTTELELYGWNLPRNTLRTALPGEAGVEETRLQGKDGLLSNPLPIAIDTLPEQQEKEPNDPDHPIPVPWPVIVDARIDTPGDIDTFQFRGRKGQVLVAEVRARRLLSPVDTVLRLFGPDGALLVCNDDWEDPEVGLETHHADSYLRVTLPANGTYRIQIEDVQHQGGPEYAYRLRLSPPRPDFALRVTPSSLNGRPGGAVPVTFHVVRRDGFNERITLRLVDAPAGFVFNNGRPAVIRPDQNQAKFNLRLPRQPLRTPVSLRFAGEAQVAGSLIRHEVVPADDLMQAFIYHHFVPARELLATTLGRPNVGRLLGQAVRRLGAAASGAKPPPQKP